MFNDRLTKPQCERLVKQLATTAFPFQCAHGRRVPLHVLGPIQRCLHLDRPSLVPLIDISGASKKQANEGPRVGQKICWSDLR